MKDNNYRKKVWLKRYITNKAKINRLNEKIYMLSQRLESVSSIRYSSQPKIKNKDTIYIEDQIAYKLELEERVSELANKGKIIKREIYNAIDTLDEVIQCEILELFFIDGLTLYEIADKTGYSERHIYRIYKKAMDIIDIPV